MQDKASPSDQGGRGARSERRTYGNTEGTTYQTPENQKRAKGQSHDKDRAKQDRARWREAGPLTNGRSRTEADRTR